MGIFERIFGKKEPVAAAKARATFQLLEGYTPSFTTWNGSIYGYAHTMEDHIIARLQTGDEERLIKGLEFAGAHAISGDGMGPQVTNGRKAAKNILDDIAAKEARKK